MRHLPTLAGVCLAFLLAAAPARAHFDAPGAVASGAAAPAAAAASDHAPAEAAAALAMLETAAVIVAAPLPSASFAWMLALPASLLVVAVARRRPRQAGVLALALVLAVFAFENAFHSAHHAAGDRHAAGCPVASASLHVAGALVDGVRVGEADARPTGRAVDAETPAPLARPLRPDQGRAPPSACA